jgi:hypothetical protein
MVRRSTPASVTDDRRFPSRLCVAVPRDGFGHQLDEMHAWLNKHAGCKNYAAHGFHRPGVREACLWYFVNVALARAFVERFGLEMVTIEEH